MQDLDVENKVPALVKKNVKYSEKNLRWKIENFKCYESFCFDFVHRTIHNDL